MPTLSQRLADGEVILIDGATGTEVERRGGAMDAQVWSGVAALSHPEIILEVHEDYIRRGAQLVIANTYSCSRHLLERAGYGDHFEELNRRGVQLAEAARDGTGADHVVVAGSISTTEMFGVQPDIEVARVNYRDQARLQAEAGADVIALEMLRDVEMTQAALNAVYAAGVPVWAGYSGVMVGAEPWLFGEEVRLAEALGAVEGQPIEAVTIMHTEVGVVDACLDVVADHWDGPVGVYAHMGRFEIPHWIYDGVISPEEYTEHALRWVDRGVQIIGGCCGVGPEHISHLREHLPARV